MEDLKPVIAKNIIALRRSNNWTQAELAQKLNYSDKAVSKWERAESLPDIIVLKEIADLYQVTIDYLLKAEHAAVDTIKAVTKHQHRNRLIIALLSASLVYLLATVLFVTMELGKFLENSWLIYIYALPVSFVVLLIFSSIWGKRTTSFVIISAIVWTALLAVYLSFLSKNVWLIFIIGIPAQVIILLCSGFKLKGK